MTTSTFILVPGAGGDAFYWHLVAPLLRDAGHEAVAVRPPRGRGRRRPRRVRRRDRPRDRRSPRRRARRPVDGRLQRPDGRRARGGVARIVLVAPMIPVPARRPASSGRERAGRRARAARSPRAATRTRRSTCTRRSSTTSPPTWPSACSSRATARDEGESLRGPWPLAAWPDIPTPVIAGARDRLFPLAFMRGSRRDRLGIEDVAVVDAGHLPALSRPEELARAIMSG